MYANKKFSLLDSAVNTVSRIGNDRKRRARETWLGTIWAEYKLCLNGEKLTVSPAPMIDAEFVCRITGTSAAGNEGGNKFRVPPQCDLAGSSSILIAETRHGYTPIQHVR